MADFEVTELPPADHVEAGDEAPEFTRPLVNEEYWEDVPLSALTDEGPVVLVFHPMDGDFPATYVWQELEERAWDEAFDVQLVGLSISSPYEHSRFLADREADCRLYSDPGNGVARAFGVVHDLDGMAGVEEPRLAVYVLEADRTVAYAWVAREWPEFPPYDEVEDALAEL